MVGQCNKCKQIKNIVGQGMCNHCYQKEFANKQKANKTVLYCKICGTALRCSHVTCRYCRQDRAIWERKARVIKEKRIPVIEKNIKICLEYIAKKCTMAQLAEKYGITKGGISYIIGKGLDYYNNRLAELKLLYGDYALKIKQYELKLNS